MIYLYFILMFVNVFFQFIHQFEGLKIGHIINQNEALKRAKEKWYYNSSYRINVWKQIQNNTMREGVKTMCLYKKCEPWAETTAVNLVSRG